MTIEELDKKIKDFNEKSDIQISGINEDTYERIYSVTDMHVDEFYIYIVKVIVNEYINKKFMPTIYQYNENPIEAVVQKYIHNNRDDIYKELVEYYNYDLDKILEYIVINQ